ncbi:MAG: hypothetical protein IPP17_31300 [Bacteroidetes bacterium]|nr:hypothetical protein [Bacteroidota bacterium]
MGTSSGIVDWAVTIGTDFGHCADSHHGQLHFPRKFSGTLADLAKCKVLALEGKAIAILDLERLKVLATDPEE